jgi:hypothetical protein
MEKRKFDREAKHIKVRLYQDDTFVTLAKTHDIGKNGMFINTDVLLFPKNSHLDVVLDSQLGDLSERTRYSATVMHRSLRGMGIRLNNNALNEDLFEKVRTAV